MTPTQGNWLNMSGLYYCDDQVVFCNGDVYNVF